MRTGLLRNISVLAHVDAGKTTVTERILYATGATYKRGEVHEGTTTTDFDPQERDRGITIFSAAVSCTWDGHRITLIDTPGHVDFTDEVDRSLRVIDGAVVVFDGVAGVQPQSETVWRQADRHGVARIAFVNKLDRSGADLDAAVASIREKLHKTPLVVQLPIGAEEGFVGVVDLVRWRSLTWVDDRMVVAPVPDELIERATRARHELAEAVAARHEAAFAEFVETSTVSPATMQAALRELTLTGEGLVVLCGAAYRNRGIEPLLDAVVAYLPSPVDVPPVRGEWHGDEVTRAADPDAPFAALVFKVVPAATGRVAVVRVYSGTVRPGDTVLVSGGAGSASGSGSASRASVGGLVRERIGRILHVQANRYSEVPSARAGEIVALVGPKTVRAGATLSTPDAPVVLEAPVPTEPVVSVAVEARRRTDQSRLATALARLVDEDPSLSVRTDAETGQTLLSGLGELHLEVAVERLRQAHAVEVTVGAPQVAYRETVVTGVTGVVYRHVKQDGGAGQFAHVVLDVAPYPEGEFVFESNVVGGRVPAPFIKAVEAGCREALLDGPLRGAPVTGVRVTLTDGMTHVKDSSELAFHTAGRLGLREALRRCAMAVLEPIVEVTATVPEEYLGAVLGDLSARRGRIGGSTARAGTVVVTATVPLAELFGYATRLRSRTQGRGTFTTRPAGYARVP
ncbi:MAG: elongation factor G [Micromonosporaceae bacterium]|nr:elongation factor G [Micromonosporaceae bacterium]